MNERDYIIDPNARSAGFWEPSEKHKGYVTCPNCHNCYIEPEWVWGMKWKFCPTCGKPLRLREEDIINQEDDNGN